MHIFSPSQHQNPVPGERIRRWARPADPPSSMVVGEPAAPPRPPAATGRRLGEERQGGAAVRLLRPAPMDAWSSAAPSRGVGRRGRPVDWSAAPVSPQSTALDASSGGQLPPKRQHSWIWASPAGGRLPSAIPQTPTGRADSRTPRHPRQLQPLICRGAGGCHSAALYAPPLPRGPPGPQRRRAEALSANGPEQPDLGPPAR